MEEKKTKTNLFAPQIFSAKKRFYLIQAIPHEKDSMIEEKDVSNIISSSFKQVFGIFYFEKLDLNINHVGNNRFIISVPQENSVPLRAAISIPILGGKIQNI